MKLDLLFPALPPALDGIGDYTAHLAGTLAEQRHEVRIWTAQTNPAPIPGVEINRAFASSPRRDIRNLTSSLAPTPPDWLILQYNPFSYGRWGLNLSLISTLQDIRRRCPETQIALMVHEPFVPIESVRFALFTIWQRWQLWRLGRLADVIFVSIEAWEDRFQGWFPESPVVHLPVGSNIPHLSTNRDEIRTTLGFGPEAFVIGLFGSGHSSRLLSFVRKAMRSLEATDLDATVLYVGPASDKIEAALEGLPLRCAGALPGPDVSRHFAAMDLYLAPYRKGVSSRRGSFLVGLQHGLPTVSTVGSQTDSFLKAHDGTSFLLAPDDDAERFSSYVSRLATDAAYRAKLAQNGQELFEETFSWPRIAASMVDVLSDHHTPQETSPTMVPSTPS